MSFTESIQTCFNKYIDFSGRASRPEYWWFALLGFGLSFIPVIGWILRLVILLPSLAVQVRRLHDMDRSAWWLLLLVPPITIIDVIILLIMSIFPGTPGPNRYGPDPLQQQAGMSGYGYADPYTPPTLGEMDQGRYTEPPPEPSERLYCTQCGTQLQADARFCTFCGASV